MNITIPFSAPCLTDEQMRDCNTLIVYRLLWAAQATHCRTAMQVAISAEMLRVALSVMRQANIGRTVRIANLGHGIVTEGGGGLASEPVEDEGGTIVMCVVYAGVRLNEENAKAVELFLRAAD